ncbi:hypothetical protein O6H91_02G073100 [Diphasiastrum complanatum]|uniref:Uncharacterized protein n=1 Tax=Diphasiastrum complanatum TaxID=34168 RepID=A0ACC2EH84_DIPCM|nr:hypothetical protein O6H91_02G073100 [Diphasiastrum complanatum]
MARNLPLRGSILPVLVLFLLLMVAPCFRCSRIQEQKGSRRMHSEVTVELDPGVHQPQNPTQDQKIHASFLPSPMMRRSISFIYNVLPKGMIFAPPGPSNCHHSDTQKVTRRKLEFMRNPCRP